MWHIYKKALKHPLRQDIFKKTYRYVVLIVYKLYPSGLICLYYTIYTGPKIVAITITITQQLYSFLPY